MFRERETDPLDLNRQLMAPGWWSRPGVADGRGQQQLDLRRFTGAGDRPVPAFQRCVSGVRDLFHRLHEPYPNPGAPACSGTGATSRIAVRFTPSS